MKNYSIDRIENGTAICEDDEHSIIKIPADKLPFDASEGDVITVFEDGAGEAYTLNRSETAKRRERAKILQKKIFRK